jgi:hypothetical protein
VFRLLPIDAVEAKEMLTELRGAAVLHGARGRPPADVDAFVALLVRVGALVGPKSPGQQPPAIPALPTGADLDLNPVAVLPVGGGAVILDAAVGLA